MIILQPGVWMFTLQSLGSLLVAKGSLSRKLRKRVDKAPLSLPKALSSWTRTPQTSRRCQLGRSIWWFLEKALHVWFFLSAWVTRVELQERLPNRESLYRIAKFVQEYGQNRIGIRLSSCRRKQRLSRELKQGRILPPKAGLCRRFFEWLGARRLFFSTTRKPRKTQRNHLLREAQFPLIQLRLHCHSRAISTTMDA